MFSARDIEAAMLVRCASVARTASMEVGPNNAREANVFRVAAMVIQSRFPFESKTLMEAADRYYQQHPEDRAPAADVVRSGDIISLPRLRDNLTRLLSMGVAESKSKSNLQ
jgi:hypothetical protein